MLSSCHFSLPQAQTPHTPASIDGAHGVLLSIAGGSDLGLFEINEAAALVSQAAHAEANIIFGAVIDDALGDEVRVTVIAAGFDGGMPKKRDAGTVLRREPAQADQRLESTTPSSQTASRPATERKEQPTFSPSVPAPVGASRPAGGEQSDQRGGATTTKTQQPPRPRQVQFDDDELDVPDFLK